MATTAEVRRCTRIRGSPLRTLMFSDHSPANRQETVHLNQKRVNGWTSMSENGRTP